ncbi:hypothetical protein RRG08_051282 [Elysia crispata]|uniref:Uncharacterized protein n=1 Tax=Elysia crispata TaxID=231223 RepID=A0AAE0YBD7_9GAST|nr:hypothetical protein RRG08_051282 [Elysia crispata]
MGCCYLLLPHYDCARITSTVSVANLIGLDVDSYTNIGPLKTEDSDISLFAASWRGDPRLRCWRGDSFLLLARDPCAFSQGFTSRTLF